MQTLKKILIKDFPSQNQEEIIARYYLEALLHLRDRLNLDQNIELIGVGEGISACTSILELLKKQFVNYDVQINTSQVSEMNDVEDHKLAQIHMQFKVKEFLPDNLTIFEYVDKYLERILELKQKVNLKTQKQEKQDIQKEATKIIDSNKNVNTNHQLQQQQQQQQEQQQQQKQKQQQQQQQQFQQQQQQLKELKDYKDYPFDQQQQYHQINQHQHHNNKFEKHDSKQNKNKRDKQKNKYKDNFGPNNGIFNQEDNEIFNRDDNEFRLLDNNNRQNKHDKNNNRAQQQGNKMLEQDEINRNKVREQNQRDVKNYREDKYENNNSNKHEQKLYEQDLTPLEYVSLLEKGQTKTRGQRRRD